MSQVTNGECVRAGKEYAAKHGREAWENLCQAWGMDPTYSIRVREIFVAGLAMGFVEALKMVRDAGGDDD